MSLARSPEYRLARDRLRSARRRPRLEAAGFEQERAEALAAQLRVAAGADRAGLATKADREALRADFYPRAFPVVHQDSLQETMTWKTS